ncbi:hypothetical protein V498_02273 [Pseudogymnoascus sp. VKM F-4517 (FW-2822)]|nr:hypothetical protein V498_02273 [Pseudogymnoascus sp. VKM F-4517 (FW-2822)]
MPAIYPASLVNTLVIQNATAANVDTTNALQVVCAWPVSGQYGIASRTLYYALIMTCIFYRKVMWLNNACMAAVWLFPAVTALHAIIIASVHVNGAVDMDIYGSFQICLTGVLSAPVTFKLSRIFYSRCPGRNTIILWTALLLSGILSLLTEFLRAHPSSCTQDGHKNFISQDPAKFPYNTTCGLTCSVEKGPFSPLRKGSGNDIYVIPAPNKLTFGTATLFAAAGCVQVVLSLISMWGRQLEFNWEQRFVGAEGSKAEEIEEARQWAPCTGAVLSVLWAYCADGGSDSGGRPTDGHVGPTDKSSRLDEIPSTRVGEPSISRSDNGDSLSILLRRPVQTPSPLRPVATVTPLTKLTRRLSAPH